MNMKKIILGLVIALVIGGIYFYSADRTTEYRQTNWEKTGYAVKNNPGMQENAWYIVYEEPGSPALNNQIRIDGNTTCYAEGEKTECIESNFLGQKIKVRGHNDNGIILVNDLTVFNSP